MLSSYETLLRRRPVSVKATTGCIVAFCGDLIAQRAEATRLESKDSWVYDAKRAAALMSLGGVWNGPLMHAYFNMLERRFPQAGGLTNLLSKTCINQLCTNPFVFLPLFFSWTGMAYGRSPHEIFCKAKREYWDSLRATWAVFTPVNFINFWLVPVRHQVTVNVAASFVYNTALSLIAAPRANHIERKRSLSRAPSSSSTVGADSDADG